MVAAVLKRKWSPFLHAWKRQIGNLKEKKSNETKSVPSAGNCIRGAQLKLPIKVLNAPSTPSQWCQTVKIPRHEQLLLKSGKL